MTKRARRLLPTLISTTMLGSASLFAATAATAQQAQPPAAQLVTLAIPAQPLASAIAAFIRTTGWEVGYSSQIVGGKTSSAVSGVMPPQRALQTLLAGTGLRVRATGPTTVALVDPRMTAIDAIAGDGVIAIDTINVDGQSAFEHVDGYVAQNASTGMKGDIPILQTPQAISVVTSDQIKDQGAQSINEALRYTAGVRTEASGSQALDNPLYVRGFLQSSLDTYQDGLRSVTPGYFGFFATDPYGLERVEVLKGPTSVLFGQQTPGGLINAVSKRPTANPVNEIELTYGSFNHAQTAFDIGGASPDKSLLYRFVGLGRNADTQVDYVKNDRVYFAPSVTWLPNPDTNLTVLTSYQRNEGDFYAQVPAAAVLLPNRYGHIPFSRFLGEPSWEGETSERTALGYELEHRFNETVKFEQNFRYTHMTNHRQYLQASGALVNERTLNRRYTLRDIDSDAVTVDNRLRFNFDTGPIEHKAIVGLDYLWGTSHWLEQSGAAASIDIFNPVYGAVVNTNAYTSRSLQDITASQAGLYLQDQLKLDKWLLTLGVRQDWAWRDTDNLIANSSRSQDDGDFTKRAGLTYLSKFGLAPYISYAESFTPVVGTDRLGNSYLPETGQQYEVGVKYQPTGYNSFVTLSAFDLRRQNVQTIDPVNTNYSVQTGEVRVQGVEIEAVASLDSGWSLTAAYTYTDAEITKTNTAGQIGNTPYRVPAHSASLWLNYEFQTAALAGFAVGGGVRYIGETWGDDANSFRVPEFTLVDAALRYDLGKKFLAMKGFTASVNVTNLFDKYYVPACFTVNACNYGSSRTIMGKLAYRW
ncbi:TonB-dependent siderophore receptor [Rhodopseudomonas palustris]|uniref:TonB-dependent siderophore receptor n=1 Tax=Rhodopseudomonas palustris TaxID=1076 RepID=UPI0002FE8F63